MRVGFLGITAAIALAAVPIVKAQKGSEQPAPPTPVQILTGTKAFISNGESDTVLGVPDLAYNEFYAAMKSWGRYELVATPAEADVVFEIRFVISGELPYLRLVILDPKTHVILWPITEGMKMWNRESTGRKNFNQAMANLVDDVRKLVGQPAVGPGAAKK